MPGVADRISWAIELLEIQPDDQLLEIGFGAGVAATLAAGRLAGGSYTGIDRSPKMVEQATQRNRELVEAGVVSFLATPVHGFDPGDLRFTKAFLVNVNLHLHDPVRDFAVLHTVLAPDGLLCLVAHPPVERKTREYAELMPALLEEAGFTMQDIVYSRFPAGTAVAVRVRRG